MDLKMLQEQVVLQEARALELGMANPTPGLIEELRYALQEVNTLRDKLPGVNGTSILRARADSVYAELSGITARWGDVTCNCNAA
jgi:hypothetical protein